MSLKEFGPNDVILNTMKAHPSCEFFIFDGKLYHNNVPERSGAFSNQVLNVPAGHVSLYEYNIDKLSGSNNFIYPFIYKNSGRESFRSITATAAATDYAYGDLMTGSYPMSASITREFMSGAAGTKIVRTTTDSIGRVISYDSPKYRHFYALKNKLNYYGTKSQHYKVSSSYGDKSLQPINLISIPSIFYGSQMKPGTLSLKWYLTGSLIGELRDTKQNGELIEVSGSNTGSVAGVVLYDEGFVLLTGSWALNAETIRLISGSTATTTPQWLYFGAGAGDGVNQTTVGNSTFTSASFNLSFKGTTETQVLTMFAHAGRGKVNYSSNPTFLSYGQTQVRLTSSQVYEENTSRTIKNTRTSSYSDYSASFERQVYVSRVAIYDDNKNLIGIATLSNPVLKKEDEDLAFKIRLDI
tara:strand:+ start:1070 stop:2305 length:1236 start_codon:yes stop_codon:yes gene_type:complete